MPLIIVPLFLLGLLLSCRDGSGRKPEGLRIISLSPHITEIIFALGADSQLVGVTDFCRYPPAAMEKEHIGGLIDPNIEKILSLKPNCLLGIPAHAELNEKLHGFGLKIHMYPNETWHDMLLTVDSIAAITGRKEAGRELIRRMKFSMDSLIRTKPEYTPKVMILIGHDPGSLRNATVAGPNTFIAEMLESAGGKNIYSDLQMRYGTVNIESMLARNPELIIDLKIDVFRSILRVADEQTWTAISGTHAAAGKNIFSISGNYTLIPGPRMLLLAEDFRAVIDSLKEAGERQDKR
jgi:iron complex transport system substrate-binding protein